MHINQHLIHKNSDIPTEIDTEAHLVLCFGSKLLLSDINNIQSIKDAYPNADIVFNSTAGEIMSDSVFENTIALTAITFETTKIISNCINVAMYKNSFDAGVDLASRFDSLGLKYLLLISDGSQVNGSELLKGVNQVTKKKILVTGGLAGDGINFESTVVGVNDVPIQGNIVAVGFCGDKLKVSHASMGGWDPFGVERTVTKSDGNVLYEIDNQNALQLYKTYLGKHALSLPKSALFFPLSIKSSNHRDDLMRTIISVNQLEKTMSFAGDIPMGSKVRFMKTNFDKIIDAASIAAKNSSNTVEQIKPELAILISCVGRKVILRERIGEEVEAVREVLGKSPKITGFYAYGEISPLGQVNLSELLNQTITITCIQEVK